MKITAAVLRGTRSPFSIEELELGDPRPDEVLVRMVATGVCHTDLLARESAEFFPGPQVYGHEGAGIVEAVGSAAGDIAVGDHVVLSFNACGSCPACDTSRRPYCFNFILELARLNAEGRFPFHELITKFPLEEINAAEAASASGVAIKPVLIF